MPLIMNDILREIHRPESLFDQHFGLGVFNDDLLHPQHSLVGPMRVGYLRPWRYHPAQRSGTYKTKEEKDLFKVNLDVQQFSPEEITVKTVDDYVVVEGKHEERQDEHGYISRQFQRRYKLPTECKPETVKSNLSSDGILTITAPKKALPPPSASERTVPIIQTNKPALKGTESIEKVDKVEEEK